MVIECALPRNINIESPLWLQCRIILFIATLGQHFSASNALVRLAHLQYWLLLIIATNPTTWNNVLYREYPNQHLITLPCCRLIITDDSDINTPAVAAAYAVKKYSKQAQDEISFEVSN